MIDAGTVAAYVSNHSVEYMGFIGCISSGLYNTAALTDRRPKRSREVLAVVPAR